MLIEARAQTTPSAQVYATACGKAIICGEHAVVYGAHAIAMPVLKLRTQSQRVEKNSQKSKVAQSVLQDAIALLDIGDQAERIPAFTLRTDLPRGAGLGASASICVLALRHCLQAIKRNIPTDHLCQLANTLEQRFHGQPSGLDTAVVAYETLISFSKSGGAKPISTDTPFAFALIDTNLRASTKAMIKVAKSYFFSANGQLNLKIIDDFNIAAKKAETGLRRGELSLIRESMDFCHNQLCQMGVVPPPVEEITQRAKDNGAVSAKVTGAGGGGMVLCLLRKDESTTQGLINAFPDNTLYLLEYP